MPSSAAKSGAGAAAAGFSPHRLHAMPVAFIAAIVSYCKYIKRHAQIVS
jgi:hypothetical protein